MDPAAPSSSLALSYCCPPHPSTPPPPPPNSLAPAAALAANAASYAPAVRGSGSTASGASGGSCSATKRATGTPWARAEEGRRN